MRMISRRRRQNFLAVCLLFVMGGSVYLGLPVHSSAKSPTPSMRRLLGFFLNVSKVILKREEYIWSHTTCKLMTYAKY